MKTFGYAGGAMKAETRKLKRRGLRGVKLVISDAHKGIEAAVAKLMNATLAALPRPPMRNALAHADESSRRVVSALMATAFAQDGARPQKARLTACHQATSQAIARHLATGTPRICRARCLVLTTISRRASRICGRRSSADGEGSAGDLVGSTMDVKETIILRVSSRVEYELLTGVARSSGRPKSAVSCSPTVGIPASVTKDNA
jgi:hypothetical protein